MTASLLVAASLLRFLDPFTSVYQTDDAAEGAALASEPGYWPVPQGLADPCAEWNKWKPRVVHAVFRVSDEPFAEYDPDRPSPLFKVNQVGYLPDAPKFAYVGAWLGPNLGVWKPKWGNGEPGTGNVSPERSEPRKRSLEGWKREIGWELVDARTGNVVYASPERPVLRIPDDTTKEGVPFTGEETYEMDFSSVTNEGTYFIRVEGVGRSVDFRIWRGAAEDAFRVHMLGLYQKRCGIAKTEPYTHWTSGACHTEVVRGTFPPEEGKLEPKTRWFDIVRCSTDWDRGERLHLVGGWHDAADYDRRPVHLNIVNDLCAVYLMRPQNFYDGQLSIPESSNGIPDILDEAEWGLRHILAGQQEDGGAGTWIESTGHPYPGNVAERDPMRYALSRATRRSSLMYAAHAALLSRCHPSFREKYQASALRAWDFAMREKPAAERFVVGHTTGRVFKRTSTLDVNWTEDRDLPVSYLVKAAVNLAALTGDGRFVAAVTNDMDRIVASMERNSWKLIPLLFAGERTLGFPVELDRFFRAWEGKMLNVAKAAESQVGKSCAYRVPWWGPRDGKSGSMAWGVSHPLRRAQYLVFAHQLTGERKYLDAISLANDFHNGCNPQGTTLTSALGEVYPVVFLDLPSYVDGIAEYVPGITPYRWTYALPKKYVEMIWGGDNAKASKWPIWRRWGNLENQTVAASEYTVWETIAPAASVVGYLVEPGASTKPRPRPVPAKSLSDLPGYWALP